MVENLSNCNTLYHGILVISELVAAQSDIQNATHMTTKGTMGGKETTEREREEGAAAGRKERTWEGDSKRGERQKRED